MIGGEKFLSAKLMKPEVSARCHQTLSRRWGLGTRLRWGLGIRLPQVAESLSKPNIEWVDLEKRVSKLSVMPFHILYSGKSFMSENII